MSNFLDNDLYKLTVGQVIHKNYTDVHVTYKLFDRTSKLDWSNPTFISIVNSVIDKLCSEYLTDKHLTSLLDLGLSSSYCKFLNTFQFNRSDLTIKDGLEITGPWSQVCLWEVPLLSILSEAHYKSLGDTTTYQEHIDKCQANLKLAQTYGITFTEFGTRRRRSKLHQDIAIYELRPVLEGTSNVEFGLKYNIPVCGTTGHEWFSGLYGIYNDEKLANKNGVLLFNQEFPENKYVLTDTFTTDFFILSEPDLLSRFNVRQDSGSTTEYIDKIVRFYKSNDVDPLERTILFTDSLDIEKCIRIRDYCAGKINCKYGIGQSITNPFGDKLNIVIKITNVNGKKVYKRSDDPSKAIGI